MAMDPTYNFCMEQDVIEVPANDVSIRFYAPTNMTVMRARSLLTKEPGTIAWVNSFLPRSCFWDVGANVGVYSLYAALKRGAKVLAVEPGAANYWVLNRNVDINQLGHLISALCLCLADTSAVGSLFMRGTAAGEALHNFGAAIDYKGAEFTPKFVQGSLSLRADELVERFGAPPPMYMKIDVDGLEKAVLAGATRILRRQEFQSLLVEVNLDDADEVAFVRELTRDCGLTEDTTTPGNFPREIGGIRIYNMIYSRCVSQRKFVE